MIWGKFISVFLATGLAANAQEAAPVVIPHGAAQISGYLAHPSSSGRVPGVLILAGRNALGEAVQRAVRELAARGFLALALDADPGRIAEKSTILEMVTSGQIADRANAALAWLAERPAVDPKRIGAIGLARGAEWVLQLARQGKLQAGVLTGEPVCRDPDELLRVRATPLLILGNAGCTSWSIHELQQKVAAGGLPHRIHFSNNTADDGFQLDPPALDAITEFFGTHLINAASHQPVAYSQAEKPIASIADIMRVINSDDGIRGRLSKALGSSPAGDGQWELLRSQAAILAESGNLLLALPPPKGPEAAWRERATEFREMALTLLEAIKRRDFSAAQEALRTLPKSCSSCHADFR